MLLSLSAEKAYFQVYLSNKAVLLSCCFRSRSLEVVGERENGRARGRHARGESPSRAPVFSCANYFQAPAAQASCFYDSVGKKICHHMTNLASWSN